MAYRTLEGGPRETIVIPVWRPRWWSLAFAVPLPLSFSRDFLNLLSPPRTAAPVMGSDELCGNPFNSKMDLYEQALHQQEHGLQRTLFFIGLMGLGLFAIGMLLRAHTTVVIDRSARVVRVSTPAAEWSAAFVDRPTLVERKRVFYLYARELTPVAIAQRGAPAALIERLRVALAGLVPRP
jgi:hypothetical protein